jgi:putative transcriptional regulator
MTTKEPKKKIAQATPDWRLHAVMANRGIKSAKDLKTALDAHGIALSVSTVSRLVYKQPVQLDLNLLHGLCSILKCTPNDLLLKTAT